MLPLIDRNIVTDSYTYVRNHNSVARAVEERLARMYGAERVVITGSGMEAITLALDWLLPQGGRIVIDGNAYYEVRQWLAYLGRYDVSTVDLRRFCDNSDPAVFEGAGLVYLDNPNIFAHYYDVCAISRAAHRCGAKVCVDNTMLSLYYMNPLRDGADLAVESYTKYVCGHGDVMAGGLVLSEGTTGVRDLGFAIADVDWVAGKRGRYVAPETVYEIGRGLETLAVRLERHTATAGSLYSRMLRAGINVWYAGKGAVLVLPGMTKELCDRFHVFRKYPTFGVTYSTTSFVRSDKMYGDVGNFVRLSVGLEDEEVLAADIAQALGLDRSLGYKIGNVLERLVAS